MKTKSSGLAAAVGVLMLFSAAAAQADVPFCVSIQSASQRMFVGTATNPCAGRIRGWNFHYGVIKPRDFLTGKPGPLTHKAVRIMKEWDTASVLLFSALVRDEILTTVVFDFFAVSQATGVTSIDHTITLRNAFVTSIERNTDTTLYPKITPPLESVEFVFQSIELTDHISKISATDSPGAQ